MGMFVSRCVVGTAVAFGVFVASSAYAAAPTLSANQSGSVVSDFGQGYTVYGHVFVGSYWWDGSAWENEGGRWTYADVAGQFGAVEEGGPITYGVGPKCNVWLCALGYDEATTLWSNSDTCVWLFNSCPQ